MAKKTARSGKERDLRRMQIASRHVGNTATIEPIADEAGEGFVRVEPTIGAFDNVTFEPKMPASAQRPITAPQVPVQAAIARPQSSGVTAARDVLTRNRAATAAIARANRAPAISREDEYRYIQADLRTVLILTVVMIVALVVLFFILNH